MLLWWWWNMSDNCHGDAASCSCKSKLLEALKDHFGFCEFRPGQMEASLSVLHGKDVFVRMATGSGKSLCMFLAPLCKSDKAIGVIISPLNGLMDQQVKVLQDIGIKAIHIGSSDSAYDSVCQGEYRFVFLSPERAVCQPWRKIYQSSCFKSHLALVAVDEAHCIPEWGSDFRTSFKKIGGIRALTDVPFMALSASAPPPIAKSIEESLHLTSPVSISHSLDRPNIFFSFAKSKGLARDVAGLTEVLKSSRAKDVPKTIIFCKTKNDCSKVYCHLLKAAQNHDTVNMYHSSLTKATKAHVYQCFKSGTQLRCLSATIAFGMGMDIADVELVVIYGLPDTVSQLYQLCGRAGRGDCQSRAHLLITGDVEKIVNPELKSLCIDQENCFREAMLTFLGGVVNQRTSRSMCCMICNPTAFDDEGGRLDVLKVGRSPPRKKRRTAIRRIDSSTRNVLIARLEAERAQYIGENASLAILGSQLVCSDSVISSISDNARFIAVLTDMDAFFLRQELKQRFFDVLLAVVNNNNQI